MWLSRGAIAVLVVLLILLKTVDIGKVTSVTRGDVTVYSAPPFVSILFGVLGIIICVLAVVYWMQNVWFHRAVSVVLFIISAWMLFNVPTGINHRVTVTPEYFFHRIGSWYSPVEAQVEFKSLAYVSIDETKRARNQRKAYELRCFTKRADEIIIPVHDLMKKALPEILKRAAAHDVVFGEGPDGRVIPLDILKR
jgi:hypothetical protein